MLTAPLPAIARNWKPPDCQSTDEQMYTSMYLPSELLPRIKRSTVLLTATQMNLKNILLSKTMNTEVHSVGLRLYEVGAQGELTAEGTLLG